MYVSGRLWPLITLGIVPVILATIGAAQTRGADPGAIAWLTVAGWVVVCALAVVTDVVAAANLRAIAVHRTAPSRARRDAEVHTEVSLANNGDRAVRGLMRDAWQPTAGASPRRIPVNVPPGQVRVVDVALLPRRRGLIRSDFIVLRAAGPLGLAGRQRRYNVGASFMALPPFHSRRHLPQRLARLREIDGNTSLQLRGQGTEFDSLREYVRGDDVRSIDWRATARADTTMLRTWRPERDRHVVVVIDTGRTSAVRVGDGVRLDAAMETALLVAALAAGVGDHVHLIMVDRVVRARVSGIDGDSLIPALVAAMAPVEPQLIDTRWDTAMAEAARMTNRPALVVVLTAQDEVEASREFLSTLAPLADKTRVFVASAVDDALGETARARGSAAEVYRAAAAERTLRDADVVTRAIVRAGAEAMTALAEDLPPRVADRYIALKRAGRL